MSAFAATHPELVSGKIALIASAGIMDVSLSCFVDVSVSYGEIIDLIFIISFKIMDGASHRRQNV